MRHDQALSNRIRAGALSGAVGTLVLNAVTYADMALRGRPASTVPADTVQETAEDVGVDLSRGQGEDVAANRRTGIGALLGFATGVAVGALYGAARPLLPRAGVLTEGLVVGAAAMVGANAGAVAAGTTDPREWGAEGWLADLVPHAGFGAATALAYARLTDHR